MMKKKSDNHDGRLWRRKRWWSDVDKNN